MYCFLFVMGDTSNSTVGSCVIDPSPKQPGRHSANQKGCSMGHITGIYDLKILVCDIGNVYFLNYVLGRS